MAADTGSGAGAGPRDAAVMEAILKEMGVTDYEPNVIHQMLEFSYSEITPGLQNKNTNLEKNLKFFKIYYKSIYFFFKMLVAT